MSSEKNVIKPPLPEHVSQAIVDCSNALLAITDKKNYEYVPIDLDCSILETPNWEKGNEPPKSLYEPFFKHLPDNKKPCIYFFEIISPDTLTILNAYKEFHEPEVEKKIQREYFRATAALKHNPPLNTTTLYVGKVKKGIGGRMVTHLGYYHVGATAGLQLVSWAKKIQLKLKLHIYWFDVSMYHFIDVLEKPLAREKNPLIGKH